MLFITAFISVSSKNMIKTIAYILLIIFTVSAVMEVFTITTNSRIVLCTDAEDGEESKDTQNENEFGKIKILNALDVTFCNALTVAGNYFISHSYLLPHPYISLEINPPKITLV
jgi:hypothetical protein